MRQVYETIIKAMNADPNRLDDYQWHEILSTLTDCATPKEKLYLHDEIQKLRVVAAEVKLGALLLGVNREENPYVVSGSSMGNYQWSPKGYPLNTTYATPEPTPLKEHNPKQLELDL